MSILLVFSWLVAVLLLQQEPCLAAQPSTPDTNPKHGRPPTPMVPRRRSSQSRAPFLPLSIFVSSLSSNQRELDTTARDRDSVKLEPRDAAAGSAPSDANVAATSETVPASGGSTSCPCWKALTTESNSSDGERTYTQVSEKKAASPLTAPSTDEERAEQHSQAQHTAETQPEETSSPLGELSLRSSDVMSQSSSFSRRHPLMGVAALYRSLPWLRQGKSASTSAVKEPRRGEPGLDDRAGSNPAFSNHEENEGTATKGSPIATSGEGDGLVADKTVSSQVRQEGAEGGSESGSPDKEVDEKGLQGPQAGGVATTLSPEQTLRTIAYLGRMCKGLPTPAKKQCVEGTLNQAMFYVSGQMFAFLNSFARLLREQRQQGRESPDFDALLHEAARIYQKTLAIHDTGVSDEQPHAASAFLASMTKITDLVLRHPLFLKDRQLQKGQELAVKCSAGEQQLTLGQVMACLLQVSLGLEESRRLMEKEELSSQGCAGRAPCSIASSETDESKRWSITSSPTGKGRRGSLSSALSKWLHRGSKDVDQREDEDR